MKQLLSRITCFLMAFQVLFASTGMAVIEHLCEVKSSKTYTLSKSKPCCLSEKKSNFNQKSKTLLKKTKCCKELSGLKKISTDTVQKLTKKSDNQKVILPKYISDYASGQENIAIFLNQKTDFLFPFKVYSPGKTTIIRNSQFLI